MHDENQGTGAAVSAGDHPAAAGCAGQSHVSARTIISIEKGHYSPSLMLAYRMAEVFETTVEELCCLRENRELEDQAYENL